MDKLLEITTVKVWNLQSPRALRYLVFCNVLYMYGQPKVPTSSVSLLPRVPMYYTICILTWFHVANLDVNSPFWIIYSKQRNWETQCSYFVFHSLLNSKISIGYITGCKSLCNLHYWRPQAWGGIKRIEIKPRRVTNLYHGIWFYSHTMATLA